MSDPTKEDIKVYLDDVRESGAINMFEAPQWLRNEFGMSPGDARDAVMAWMEATQNGM